MPKLRPATWAAAAFAVALACGRPEVPVRADAAPVPDRSPCDLALTSDERYLLTANSTSDSVSLVRVADGAVVAEAAVGKRPARVRWLTDTRVLVTGSHGGDLTLVERDGDALKVAKRVALGFEPRGIAVAPDGKTAYVALTTAHAVAQVDLESMTELRRFAVGRWPRDLVLTPDGKTLAVGVNGDGGVAVVDAVAGKVKFVEDFGGINLGQMQLSADSKFVYFPWMIYRLQPITSFNLKQGWVLASRIARVRLDEHARREAISLDARGRAVADPHGLALSPDEKWLYCTAAGTHELLCYKNDGLPLMDYGGPGDHIDEKLLTDDARFWRIPLGGRPMAIRPSRDGQRVFVANYLLNSVQVVDPHGRTVVRTIPLGGPPQPSLARTGEAIFYDGKRSMDQWYSCHSCHQDGHTNAVTVDTKNDGRFGNYKTVLSLRNVTKSGPYFWHGWADNLDVALEKSLVDSMLGPEPRKGDAAALRAYLEALPVPPNPYRTADGGLSDAAKRGEAVFRSEAAGCARCHKGPLGTDGKVHDVGTGEKGDVYKGYNTPLLAGCYDRAKYLHDGRAKTLEATLTGAHNPDALNGRGGLSAAELADLVAYLKSL